MLTWLRNTYTKLNLDPIYLATVQDNRTNPYTVFAQIVKAILAEPERLRPIVDEIAADRLIRTYFPPDARNQLSRIYPADKELAATLLLDTTSYYKCKERPVYSHESESYICDEDGEEITIPYYVLINHTPEYYFMLSFYDFPKHNTALSEFLKDNGVNPKELEYYKKHDGLWELYKKRSVTVTVTAATATTNNTTI